MSSVLTGMDWTPILGVLVTLIGGLLTWLANGIKAKNEAATAKSKAEAASLKLAAIGAALLQKAWADLGPKVQAALADGKLDDAERTVIEVAVEALLKDVTDAETLKEISEALGLPLPGLIAKIAATLISTWTAAHDPVVTTASKMAYPVQNFDGPDYKAG